MDPTQALADLRSKVMQVRGSDCIDFDDFIDRFNALDEWLTNGGFLPVQWRVG